MALPAFRFQPFPGALYSYNSLFEGFDPARPESFAEMHDSLIYQDYIARGGAACGDYLTSMGRAMHDSGISLALADAVQGKKLVAILGGHDSSRRDPMYAETARLAAKLTEAGFTMVSGGGPGVMEATHLGAMFAGDPGLEDALARMAAKDVPEAIPHNAGLLVDADGKIDPEIARTLGAYLAPAAQIRLEVGHGGGIGIPTWLYGHEPSTPFAGEIAKYFENSIREEGLLALATSGVIYMPGRAGTLQEVFQDATQNYYKTFPTGPGKHGMFSPVVFFGDFWTREMPVKPVLDALFGASAPKEIQEDYARWVRFLSDTDQAIAHLKSFRGEASPVFRILKHTV